MYNLRFYLDENGNVERCCFKKIPTRDEIDILTYQDIIWDKKKLKQLVNYLIDNSINHSSSKNIHDFKVTDEDIKSMLKESREYKHRMAIKKENAIEKGKFTPTKKKEKEKERIKRRNRLVGLIAIVSMSTLVALGSVVVNNAKKKNTNTNEPAQEYTLPNNDYIDFLNNNIEIVDQRAQEIVDNYYDNLNQEEKESKKDELVEEIKVINGIVPQAQNMNENQMNEVNYDSTFSLYTTDNTSEKKFIDCKNLYYDLVKKYSDIYGIDPNLAIAIACQERGEHSELVDPGGGLGLFQIQVEGNGFKWEGKEITAYNFETNSYETYKIETANVKNLEENIKAGLMILQDDLRRNNYNIALGVQEYNMGYPGVQQAMQLASDELKIDKTIFNNVENTEWINYRRQVGYGDPIYLENVFRYVDDEEVLHFRIPDGSTLDVRFDNLSYEKMAKK